MSLFIQCVVKLLPLAAIVLADVPLYTGSNSGYQDKAYGLYPNQSYQSSNLTSPIFQVNTAGDNVSNASHVFIGPAGNAVKQIGPMIFGSSNLDLVWSGPQYGVCFGVRVQQYNNSAYITFWRGQLLKSGYGSGSCLMLDNTYRVAYNLTTQNLTGTRRAKSLRLVPSN